MKSGHLREGSPEMTAARRFLREFASKDGNRFSDSHAQAYNTYFPPTHDFFRDEREKSECWIPSVQIA